eukprot:gene3477-6922_t
MSILLRNKIGTIRHFCVVLLLLSYQQLACSSDIASICDLATSMNISSTVLSGWNCKNFNATTRICLGTSPKWERLTCSVKGAIIGIDLSGLGLRGTLPTSLGRIKALTSLSLYSNLIYGSIPSSFGNLNKLIQLNLGMNNLIGEIPETITNLTSLTYLNISSNNLGDETSPSRYLPGFLGLLSKLQYLALGSNLFTGIIPDTIGDINSLTYLNLSVNSLTGSIPVSLGYPSALAELYLFTNNLTGSIPSILCDNSLTSIIISNGANFGSLTDCGDSPVVTSLNVSMCELATALSVSTTTSYKGWICADNEPTTSICMRNKARWDGVSCRDSKITAIVLISLNLKGSLPVSLGNINTLTRLSFKDNSITGKIPTTLNSLIYLFELNLQKNSFTGSIPTSITTLKFLSYLALNDNLLTNTIPTSLGSSAALRNVLLYDNRLSGSIPDSLCESSFLTVLLLYYPYKVTYTTNTALTCYAPCLSTVSNVGYSMAYGKIQSNRQRQRPPATAGRLQLQHANTFHDPMYNGSREVVFAEAVIIQPVNASSSGYTSPTSSHSQFTHVDSSHSPHPSAPYIHHLGVVDVEVEVDRDGNSLHGKGIKNTHVVAVPI